MEGADSDGDDAVAWQQQEKELVAARFFPLDPLFLVYCKLFICQLWQMECTSPSHGVFSLNGHPISRAEICGTVVRRDQKESRLLFVVDDASGLLEILVWERRFERETPIDWDRIVLGALVRVRGRLAWYRDCPQMTLSSIDFLPEGSDGAIEEVAQWQRIAELNATAYQSSLSHLEDSAGLVAEEQLILTAIGQGEHPPQSVMEVMGAIFRHLSLTPTGVCSEWDLRGLFRVGHEVIRAALVQLCDHGGAYWLQDEPVVTQIRPDDNLAEAIWQVMQLHRPRGLTLLDIHKALVEDYRWKCVRDDQLGAALEIMAQERSQVYNGGDGVWHLV